MAQEPISEVTTTSGDGGNDIGQPVDTVRDFASKGREKYVPLANAGAGGGGGGMDRIDQLEKTVSRLDGDIGTVKSDVSGMRTDLSEIRISLAELNSKLNIGEIRSNVEKVHTDIYKWLATVVISIAGLGLAIYAGLKASSAPPQPQQPLVIQVPNNPAVASPPQK
jgi:hypothetical protein